MTCERRSVSDLSEMTYFTAWWSADQLKKNNSRMQLFIHNCLMKIHMSTRCLSNMVDATHHRRLFQNQ
jgi:hypothetical protein